MSGADREALPDLEAAYVVGVDAVGVLKPGGAEAGRGLLVELVGVLVDAAGAGDVDELGGERCLVEEDGFGGANDPRAGFVAAHAFRDLGAECGGHAEAARAFDDVDERVSRGRDRGELVDDEEDALVAWFAADGPLSELFDEEPGEVPGLVLEAEPVEEEVATQVSICSNARVPSRTSRTPVMKNAV